MKIKIPNHILNSPNRTKIDFFGIGAAKCGSTWLAQCLDEHPQITIAKGKEPNFFVRNLTVFDKAKHENFLKSWDWYNSFFNHAPHGNKTGDFSIHLLHNIPEAPELIKYFYPDAKFIVIFRDPVKKTYSNYWFEREYNKVEGVPSSFEEAVKNPELLYRSKYYAQLSQWLRIFPLKQFFIVLDIDMRENPENLMESLFDFLEVDKHFKPPSLYRRINESSKVKWPRLLGLEVARILRHNNLDCIVDCLNRLGVREVVNKISIKKFEYPPINPETEQYLRKYFLSDIEQLEKLINRDLTPWKTTNIKGT